MTEFLTSIKYKSKCYLKESLSWHGTALRLSLLKANLAWISQEREACYCMSLHLILLKGNFAWISQGPRNTERNTQQNVNHSSLTGKWTVTCKPLRMAVTVQLLPQLPRLPGAF